MPGRKKSLNRRFPGSRIIEFAGIASGVQTATDDAIRTAITTARGSAPSAFAMDQPIGQKSAHVAVLLITCVSPHTVSHRIAMIISGPCPPATETTACEMRSAAPVFIIAVPSGVMNERRNTACMSNAANASFCVITRKRTTAIAPTQAVICIGGRSFVKSAAIIAAIVRTKTPTVNQPRHEEV